LVEWADNMNMLIALLVRIAGGEKYKKTGKEDVVVWFSFLAAFPFTISISLLMFRSSMRTAPLWSIWLMWIATILIGLGVWFGVTRLRSIMIILILAVAGWIGTYFVIYRLS
jgi:uncharacterized membrane protein